MQKRLTQLLTELVYLTEDLSVALCEYEIADIYANLKQYSAAFTYYTRCTGRNINKEIIYAALIKAGLCLRHQGNRQLSVKTLMQHAVNVLPDRPEAYFHLSLIAENQQEYFDCYTLASLGVYYLINGNKIKDLGYPGDYALIYQKAFAAWHVGRSDECRETLQRLRDYNVDDRYKQLIQNNMSRLGSSRNTFVPYIQSDYEKLKVKFPKSETIQYNHSQTYQDMFVLTMLNGKENGIFLEIGAADPFYGSNTALLEKFGWNGISIDIQEEEIKKFNSVRNCTALVRDGLSTNYKALLESFTDKTDIDYLQLDCEPPENTLKILMSIPFETYRFAVITFEHDYYCDFDRTIRDKSRKYLEAQGYELVVSNVSADNIGVYEDWWIHPDLVNEENKNILKSPKKSVNYIKEVFLNN